MNATLFLTDVQVRAVIQSATGAADVSRLLSGVDEMEWLRSEAKSLLEDPKCSQTMLRGFLVLAAFPADGGDRGLVEVARELNLPPGTVHRYIYTWVGVGALVQNPHSRRYRRVIEAHSQTSGGNHAA